jgi:hypothetical protein
MRAAIHLWLRLIGVTNIKRREDFVTIAVSQHAGAVSYHLIDRSALRNSGGLLYCAAVQKQKPEGLLRLPATRHFLMLQIGLSAKFSFMRPLSPP